MDEVTSLLPKEDQIEINNSVKKLAIHQLVGLINFPRLFARNSGLNKSRKRVIKQLKEVGFTDEDIKELENKIKKGEITE